MQTVVSDVSKRNKDIIETQTRHNSWSILSRNLSLFCPCPEILCQAKSKYNELNFGRGNFQIGQLGYSMASAYCSYPNIGIKPNTGQNINVKKMHFCEEQRKFKVATNLNAKKEAAIVKDKSALHWDKQARGKTPHLRLQLVNIQIHFKRAKPQVQEGFPTAGKQLSRKVSPPEKAHTEYFKKSQVDQAPSQDGNRTWLSPCRRCPLPTA